MVSLTTTQFKCSAAECYCAGQLLCCGEVLARCQEGASNPQQDSNPLLLLLLLPEVNKLQDAARKLYKLHQPQDTASLTILHHHSSWEDSDTAAIPNMNLRR